ncbi:MAG: hypothetical protein HY472_00360 [Candidatus Sungbacteria bacterium]|nr:hypothetical protein [Candidatus Sungbacteria bacterium]
MSSILGHARQIAYLNNALAKSRIAHGYVFFGPEEVGKRTIALGFLQALLCREKPKTLDGVCGQCDSCARCARGAHPAVIALDAKHHVDFSSEEKNAITIDDIREVRRLFSYAAGNTPWRCLIMDHAEQMTHDAASAFLKLFEEPGERTLMILVTSAPDLLPKTILSRAQVIGFSLVPETLMSLYQAKLGTASESGLRTYAGGRPGRLIRLHKDPAFQKEHKEIFTAAAAVAEGKNAAETFALSERIALDPRLRVQCVENIVSILRGRMIRETGSGAGEIARRIRSVDRIAGILESTHVNPRLAMDVLLLGAATSKEA